MKKIQLSILLAIVVLLSACEKQDASHSDKTELHSESEILTSIDNETFQYPGQTDTYEYNVYETYVEIVACHGDDIHISIPDEIEAKPVRVIGKEAFEWNTTIQTITMSDNIWVVKEKAFYGCSNVQSVQLSKNLRIIGKSAFNACKSVDKFTLPEKITTIGEYAFANCIALKEINIPKSVTQIGKYAIGWNGSWESGHQVNANTCIIVHKASFGLDWVINQQKYEQLTNYKVVD